MFNVLVGHRGRKSKPDGVKEMGRGEVRPKFLIVPLPKCRVPLMPRNVFRLD